MTLSSSPPLRAIREKCLDCCCGSVHEVRLCHIEDCSLHIFRFGSNPYNRRGKASAEQLKGLAQRRNRNGGVSPSQTGKEKRERHGESDAA